MKTSIKQYYINAGVQTEFLDKSNIPKISEKHKNTLDKQLSIAEISEARSTLQAVKTAGLDGLPIDFYKQFKDKLVTPLYNMYLESYSDGYLPTSVREALIILLSKPGKTNNKCKNMRPISLIDRHKNPE